MLFCERASEPEENSHYRVSYCFARARYWIPCRPLAAKQTEREQERPGEKRERGAVGSDKETLKEAEREREREREGGRVCISFTWIIRVQKVGCSCCSGIAVETFFEGKRGAGS